jgi:hypothetical protein
MDVPLLVFLALYGCVGVGLAIASLAVPASRRTIWRLAKQTDMNSSYAHTIWLVGTCLAWPIGIYVLLTGRLFYIGKGFRRSTRNETPAVMASASQSWDLQEAALDPALDN